VLGLQCNVLHCSFGKCSSINIFQIPLYHILLYNNRKSHLWIISPPKKSSSSLGCLTEVSPDSNYDFKTCFVIGNKYVISLDITALLC
jgi:hypothetical protein